ncbi:DUF2945 domain-containing protein [Polymorphobacter fuscus]|uniref:DUF2945 domain-containing protein n=1 Tax=Sandarakinorhabdus fusca TaxID=1439888 RepID=A0A7C9GXT1_9SPHN|nr:DUF2945 domain-containing protein [Polymorphobacter fuscus]KAB7646330.1 DUF2945 domain-containing protein [Polymorphobacter fuscus]MQT17554.1 DUF2945 domain-containing protein [Polymorphobacter fuscus]NJC09904.1 hypothetical protein [Polymorphobacter fuscus]
MADKKLKVGDTVEWDSAGGHSRGTVTAKVTKTAKVKGHVAKATPDDPQYKVRSESGGEAIHKPGALKKTK